MPIRPALATAAVLAFGLTASACPAQPEPTTPVEDLTCDATGASQDAVVAFQTADGLTLRADYRTASVAGRPAVVLVHMIPPGNDRSGYPERVRAALAGSTSTCSTSIGAARASPRGRRWMPTRATGAGWTSKRRWPS